MHIEPFKPEDMAAIEDRLNPMQSMPASMRADDFGNELLATSEAYTTFADDGRVVSICGAMQMWPGRYHLFAYMAVDSGPCMVGITRGVRRFIETHPGRHETQVAEGFEAGHRWVRMMGFQCETPDGMRDFFPGGRTGYQYSKVIQ